MATIKLTKTGSRGMINSTYLNSDEVNYYFTIGIGTNSGTSIHLKYGNAFLVKETVGEIDQLLKNLGMEVLEVPVQKAETVHEDGRLVINSWLWFSEILKDGEEYSYLYFDNDKCYAEISNEELYLKSSK